MTKTISMVHGKSDLHCNVKEKFIGHSLILLFMTVNYDYTSNHKSMAKTTCTLFSRKDCFVISSCCY